MKRRIVEEVDRRRDEFVALLSRVVQFNTDNPPSDTRALAAFIADWLRARGIAAEVVMPYEPYANVVAALGPKGATPHLTLNGHLDQFPADEPSLWRDGPYSGVVRDGKIYGRGVSDMKGGTTASLIAFALMKELEVPLRGRLSFTAVADEESGGEYGTRWILAHHQEYVGQACLNGEPYAPDVVGIGERGTYRVILRAEGEPMHGSLSSGDNCIMRMAEALLALRPLVHEKSDIPRELEAIVERQRSYTRSPQDAGKGYLLDHPSYNVGVIRGGTKLNVVPRFCEAEVDIRLPVGFSVARMDSLVKRLLREAGRSDVTVTPARETAGRAPDRPSAERTGEPTWTSPDERLVQIVRANAAAQIGKEPIYYLGLGATDGRLFRAHGVPTVIYGPRPFNMGGIDEHIAVDDFLTVVKVHALTIVDYLGLA
ncbi:MAG TPA: ArgE/DapE family deacylase [Thermodesulfobacteriota bacterium]